MSPEANIYARPEVDQSERAKYVASLINQLRGLETKTDPKGGAQSGKGKNLAALEALGIASNLVRMLAGWALDHEAGLALKGLKDVPLAANAKKPPEDSDNSNTPPTNDDHRHEWYGRNWLGRLGEAIDPIVARKWLYRLVLTNPGIFEPELMLQTLTALEECDYGEITPMLKATKTGRKVNWSMLDLQMKALSFVNFCVGRGMKKEYAQKEVAKAFGVGVDAVRSWEHRLKDEFGDDVVASIRETGKEYGARNSEAKGLASLRAAHERHLLEYFGRRYIEATDKKRAKRLSSARP